MVAAALVAGTLSGVPSTVHALVTGRPLLAATRAAGNLVLPADAPAGRLVAAGAAVHAVLSFGWAAVLVRVLPRRHPLVWGAVAGATIAAVDLGTVGRRRRLLAALPVAPQVADHVVFGLLVGAVVARSAARRSDGPAVEGVGDGRRRLRVFQLLQGDGQGQRPVRPLVEGPGHVGPLLHRQGVVEGGRQHH